MSVLEMLLHPARRHLEEDLSWKPDAVYWVALPGREPLEYGNRDQALDSFERLLWLRRDGRVKMVDPTKVDVVMAHGHGVGAPAHRATADKTAACGGSADKWLRTTMYMAASHAHPPCRREACFIAGWVTV